MAVDKLVDSTQLNADLTAVANAIRTKGGTSAQLAFPAGFVSAVEAIPTGGGGNATIETGTFTRASSIVPSNSGSTIPIGFFGHPDILYCWYDRQEFIDRESYASGWWRFALIKNDVNALSTVPYIRQSASTDVQSLYTDNVSYILVLSPALYDSSDANNAAGKANQSLGYYPTNKTLQKINSDGTITLAKYSTATIYLYAGTYHYMAITLPSGIYLPMPV